MPDQMGKMADTASKVAKKVADTAVPIAKSVAERAPKVARQAADAVAKHGPPIARKVAEQAPDIARKVVRRAPEVAVKAGLSAAAAGQRLLSQAQGSMRSMRVLSEDEAKRTHPSAKAATKSSSAKVVTAPKKKSTAKSRAKSSAKGSES